MYNCTALSLVVRLADPISKKIMGLKEKETLSFDFKERIITLGEFYGNCHSLISLCQLHGALSSQKAFAPAFRLQQIMEKTNEAMITSLVGDEELFASILKHVDWSELERTRQNIVWFIDEDYSSNDKTTDIVGEFSGMLLLIAQEIDNQLKIDDVIHNGEVDTHTGYNY